MGQACMQYLYLRCTWLAPSRSSLDSIQACVSPNMVSPKLEWRVENLYGHCYDNLRHPIVAPGILETILVAIRYFIVICLLIIMSSLLFLIMGQFKLLDLVFLQKEVMEGTIISAKSSLWENSILE